MAIVGSSLYKEIQLEVVCNIDVTTSYVKNMWAPYVQSIFSPSKKKSETNWAVLCQRNHSFLFHVQFAFCHISSF